MGIITAHLFAGAGGDILAGLILGHEPVVAVECSKFCCDVLRERKEDGWLPSTLEIIEGDIREVDFSRWEGRVDQISAGFPCQDISVAGTQKGIKGERSGLVWEVLRAIDVIRPSLVFLENSPNIRTKGRVEIVQELVSRGYAWRDGTLAAFDVGAPHKRNRWWLLAANADGLRNLQSARRWAKEWLWSCCEDNTDPDLCGRHRGAWHVEKQERWEESTDNAPDALRDRLQGAVQQGWLSAADAVAIEAAAGHTSTYGWSPVDAGVCGVVHGLADPMDGAPNTQRIKALGNGQVPLQSAAAWLILAGAFNSE